MRTLYGIWDTVAQDIIGPVQTFKHEAQAVRFFREVLSSGPNIPANDLQLVKLADLDSLLEQKTVMLDGPTLIAAQPQTETNK